jgi:GMP synthase (glutamine-hydrolysing)
MQDMILILDFGSQYTQLIARRVRELNVYCEIHPFNKIPDLSGVTGVILSGSPFSTLDENSPSPDLDEIFSRKIPLLGVCYGAQYLAKKDGGEVQP